MLVNNMKIYKAVTITVGHGADGLLSSMLLFKTELVFQLFIRVLVCWCFFFVVSGNL